MIRAFLRTLFGFRGATPSTTLPAQSAPTSPAPQSAPSAPARPWRDAPTRTWSDDVVAGISVSLTVTTGHHGFLSVVGESHYQDALRRLAAGLGADGVFTARLVPEPDNPYDANAVAVCVDSDLAKVGYLARAVAKTYHTPLARHVGPITCPAKLTGVGLSTLGVVLDFEDARVALGLPRVSVDQSDQDYEAAASYRRILDENRVFVKETRPFEQANLTEAVARYRRAVATLSESRDLARAKGLDAYGYEFNQTDAEPIDRLTLCLIKMGKTEEAAKALDKFVEDFPHTHEMRLITMARERVERARQGRPRARRKPSAEAAPPASSTDKPDE